MKHKIIICLIALALAAAAFSIVSADTNSLLEFFGFGKPTQTPTPAAETAVSGKKVQDPPAADEDPFADYDPALLEPDDMDLASKDSDEFNNDAWKEDPYAYSFSGSRFDEFFEEVTEENQQKQAPQGPGSEPGPIPGSKPPSESDPFSGPKPPAETGQRPGQKPDPRPDPYINIPQEPDEITQIYFYPIYNHPVFRPMYELPRTGITGKAPVQVSASINYGETSMSLSIPTLNINEDIVIVPLVDDSFPVEGLGSNIGLLEGSGPGKDDLFVLAGHNHINQEEKGPFATLSALRESDLIFIRGAKNASRTFVVYANEKFAADDIEGLGAFARPGCMILITCEDESTEGGYLNRRVIFAEAKED